MPRLNSTPSLIPNPNQSCPLPLPPFMYPTLNPPGPSQPANSACRHVDLASDVDRGRQRLRVRSLGHQLAWPAPPMREASPTVCVLSCITLGHHPLRDIRPISAGVQDVPPPFHSFHPSATLKVTKSSRRLASQNCMACLSGCPGRQGCFSLCLVKAQRTECTSNPRRLHSCFRATAGRSLFGLASSFISAG